MNVGLNKIAETVGQVEEMQKSLAVKSAELQAKNDMANAKLKQMVRTLLYNPLITKILLGNMFKMSLGYSVTHGSRWRYNIEVEIGYRKPRVPDANFVIANIASV